CPARSRRAAPPPRNAPCARLRRKLRGRRRIPSARSATLRRAPSAGSADRSSAVPVMRHVEQVLSVGGVAERLGLDHQLFAANPAEPVRDLLGTRDLQALP